MLSLQQIKHILQYYCLDMMENQETVMPTHIQRDCVYMNKARAEICSEIFMNPKLKNIIFKEQQPDGFIFDFYNVKDKLYTPVNDSIIISNQTNNLKKYILILDSYKRFTLLLRKTLDEC